MTSLVLSLGYFIWSIRPPLNGTPNNKQLWKLQHMDQIVDCLRSEMQFFAYEVLGCRGLSCFL